MVGCTAERSLARSRRRGLLVYSSRMKKIFAIALIAAGLAFGTAKWAAAHHSHAMFDTSREVTITGTVTNFVYRNPHVFLYVDVKGDDGEVKGWSVEMSNIANMER